LTPENILHGWRNCGIISDTRPGFTSIKYALGCCKYCKSSIKQLRNKLFEQLIAYNNSYCANNLPYRNTDLQCERYHKPIPMCDTHSVFNSKPGYLTQLPPMIIWFLNTVADIITNKCDNERRYQYDNYTQIDFAKEHILMDDESLACAIVHHYDGDCNTICNSCLFGWRNARSLLYDLLVEYNTLWDAKVELTIDVKYKLTVTMIDHKLKTLESILK
jgi:hypothetical protein